MKIKKADLKTISKEINLSISDNYLELIYKIFLKINYNLETVKNINVKNIKPLNMIFENNEKCQLREDDCVENLSKNDALLNAPKIENDFIVIDKVN